MCLVYSTPLSSEGINEQTHRWAFGLTLQTSMAKSLPLRDSAGITPDFPHIRSSQQGGALQVKAYSVFLQANTNTAGIKSQTPQDYILMKKERTTLYVVVASFATPIP